MNKELNRLTSVLKGMVKPWLEDYYTNYQLDYDETCSYCENYDDHDDDAWYHCMNRQTIHCTLCKPERTTCPNCHERICLFQVGQMLEKHCCPKCHIELTMYNPIKLSPERMKEVKKQAKEISERFQEKISQGEEDDT